MDDTSLLCGMLSGALHAFGKEVNASSDEMFLGLRIYCADYADGDAMILRVIDAGRDPAIEPITEKAFHAAQAMSARGDVLAIFVQLAFFAREFRDQRAANSL